MFFSWMASTSAKAKKNIFQFLLRVLKYFVMLQSGFKIHVCYLAIGIFGFVESSSKRGTGSSMPRGQDMKIFATAPTRDQNGAGWYIAA